MRGFAGSDRRADAGPRRDRLAGGKAANSRRLPWARRLHFLELYDPARFERPSVAVDVALVSAAEGRLHTLVVRRTEHPAKGKWALPGGFVGIEEPLEAAAARVLEGKTGLEGIFVEQLYTFGDPERDPGPGARPLRYPAPAVIPRRAAPGLRRVLQG